MKLGFGSLGFGGSVAPAGIPASFDLGAWDLSALTGPEGDIVYNGIPSLVGANVLLPLGQPTLDDVGIGGRRALKLSLADKSYASCNALASRFTFGNSWTVVSRYRSTSLGSGVTLWSAGSSLSSIANYFRVYATSLGEVQITSNTAAGGTITRITSGAGLQFNEHDVMITCSASGTLTVYVDGVAFPLNNSTMETNALTCNRFGVGAELSTGPNVLLEGYVQWFGVSSNVFSASEALAFSQLLRSSDAILPKSASKQVMYAGDSITETGVGTLRQGGIREYQAEWVVDNGLSIRHVGSRVAGYLPNRENSAQGGAFCATVRTLVDASFDADPTCAPDLIICQMGTNGIGGSVPTVLASWRVAANAMAARQIARNPTGRFACSVLTPLDPAVVPGATNVDTFNAGLLAAGTGEFDVFDAAHPSNPMVRLDNAAPVVPFSATNFNDDTHPNEVGCQKIGAAQILVTGPIQRTLSTTIRTLYVNFLRPSATQTLMVGVPVVIRGRVSRYPSTVAVRRTDGTLLFNATMSKRPWSFTYSPVTGDLGAQTLTATVTDTLDGSTATATLAVTVVASAYTPRDEGNVVGNWDVTDPLARIVDGSGNCVGLRNKITDVIATEVVAPPAYQATGGPGGTVPAVTFSAASLHRLVSPSDPVFGAALSGVQQSWSWKGVVKFTATGASGLLFSAGRDAVTRDGIGQLSGKYWATRTPDSNIGTQSSNLVTCVSGWALLEVTFDGAASTLTTRVNNGTAQVTTGYTFTTATFTRWAFGCGADNLFSFPASGSFTEGWMSSDVQTGKAPSGGKDASDRVYNYLVAKYPGLGLAAR